MIVFEGKPTNECRKFLIKKHKKGNWIPTSVTAFLLSIPLVWLCFLNVNFGFLLITIWLIPLFSLMPPGKKEVNRFLPHKVLFDTDESTVVISMEKGEHFRMLNEVKRVYDYRYWYYLDIDFGDPYFICQKDLLTEGTLEEFEALFEGKIVRMNES